MDLINEQDMPIWVFAKLILGVHQYEAPLCSFLLSVLEQGKGRLTDLDKQNIGSRSHTAGGHTPLSHTAGVHTLLSQHDSAMDLPLNNWLMTISSSTLSLHAIEVTLDVKQAGCHFGRVST